MTKTKRTARNLCVYIYIYITHVHSRITRQQPADIYQIFGLVSWIAWGFLGYSICNPLAQLIIVCYGFALELFPSALSLQRKWMEAATVMPMHDGPGLAMK